MSAVIFAGPSIRKPDIAAIFDEAVILPPAAMGDVYRAAQRRPRAIGIIDGYFEGAPSVWHKEILWALAKGIAVFGAASMGALRAAELSDFGMRGIGSIFTDYLSGRLEDDDEVAVEHGPEETGYITLSEPMVNIRATLDRAVLEGIVPDSVGRDLAALAKQQFYKERSWESLLRLARGAGAAAPALETLAEWLPGNAIDRKREDAVQMAMAMAAFMATPVKPSLQDFAFEWSVMWERATRSFISHYGNARSGELPITAALVLDELRLDPDRYAVIRRGAISRKLMDAETLPDHAPMGATTLRQALSRFRERHGLLTHHSLLAWLNDNGLDEAAFEQLIEDEIRLDRVAAGHGLDRHLLAELQQAGAYSGLARRAQEKQRVLDGSGPYPWQNRLHIMQARLWYFETFLVRPLPEDIGRYATELGFADLEALDRAIASEFAFQRQLKGTGKRPDQAL